MLQLGNIWGLILKNPAFIAAALALAGCTIAPSLMAEEIHQIKTPAQFKRFLSLLEIALRPQFRQFKCMGTMDDDKINLVIKIVSRSSIDDTQTKSLIDRAISNVAAETIDCDDVESQVNDQIQSYHASKTMNQFPLTGVLE